MLSSWFGIRGALDRPEESGWGPLHQQHFSEAYPSLKTSFDAIADSMFDIAPRVNRDLPVLPAVANFGEQAGRTEPYGAAPTGVTSKSDENFDDPLEDAGGRQVQEDVLKPTLGKRTQRSGKQARDAKLSPTDEDE
ncbi:hypothetical protein FRC00_005622 [Tulasnella sp. 408]|nr:hypothetical protein FRC00_005622 [Tulasnella sp. 408]